jgi:hypothetical protein
MDDFLLRIATINFNENLILIEEIYGSNLVNNDIVNKFFYL